jgi:site-specific recombinase XerD
MHNQWLEPLVRTDYSKATLIGYRTTFRHLKAFIKHTYKRNDFLLQELDLTFLADLDYYFKTIRSCNHNSSLKYIRLFKKVVNWSRARKWIVEDPFVGHKSRTTPVNIDFLTMEELQKIEKKTFTMPGLRLVTDVFIFSCYTGLAYVDVAKLRRQDIQTINDVKWIITSRTKTDIPARVPLLPKAEDMVNLYLKNENGDNIFPILSNQKTDSYLKEIADLCEIKKRLNFQLARHTFALQ